jgi:hypothetical protein
MKKRKPTKKKPAIKQLTKDQIKVIRSNMDKIETALIYVYRRLIEMLKILEK